MGTVASLVIKITGDVAGLKTALSDAASSVSAAGDKMQGLGTKLSLGVTAPIAGIAAMAVNSAATFEQSMNVMQQVSGATAAEMQGLQEQALQLGAQTSFSAGEAAAAMLELSKAGLSASEVAAAIGGTLDLAAAGGLGLAQAAEITANAVNAFGLEASQANSVANLLAAAANASSVEVTDLAYGMQMAGAVFSSSGQSLETLNTALALLGNNGLKGSDAGTSLKTMLMSLTAPTDTAAKQLQSLGVSVYDAAGNMRALPDVMNDLQSALYGTHAVTVTSSNLTAEQAERMSYLQKTIKSTQKKLADYQAGIAGVAQSENDKVVAVDRLNRVLAAAQAEYAGLASIGGTTSTVMQTLTEAQRNQALTAIFGSDAIRAANILLKEGTTGWQEMAAALGNETAAADVANARMKGMAGAVEYFKGSVDSFLISTALPFLDSMSGIVRMAADGITALGSLPEPVQQVGLAVAAVAAAAGPALIGLGTALKVAAAGMSGLAIAMGVLTGPIGLLVAAVAALGAAWYFNWGGIREITASVVASVGETLTALGQYFLAVVEDGDYLNDWLTHLPEVMQEPTAAIGQFVAEAGAAWQRLTEAFASGQTSVSGVVGELVALFTGLGADLYSTTENLTAFVAALTGSGESASQVTATIVAASESFAAFRESAVAAFEQFSASVQTVMAQVGEILAPAFERVQEAFGGLGENVGQLAPHFEGLLTAVQGMGEAILPVIEGVAQALGVTLVVAASLGVNLFAAVLGRLPGIVGPVIDQVTLTINTISATVTAVAGAIAAAAEGDWAGAWESLKGVVTAFETFVSETWTNVTTMLGNVGAAIGEAVVNTLNDLGLSEAAATVQSMIDGLGALGEKITEVLSGEMTFAIVLPDWVSSLLAWRWPALSMEAPAWLTSLLTWAWPSFPTVPDVLSSLVNWKWPSFPALPSILDTLVSWNWPSFPSAPSWLDRLLSWSWPEMPGPVADAIGGVGQAVNDAWDFVTGGNRLGTAYAHGGWSWVGEAGPELVRLPRGAQVFPSRESQEMVGQGGGVNVTIQQATIRGEQDIWELAHAIESILRRQ
jgi:TP901 family phage tail tape measure protein